mmetsp:Transcript_98404/g.300929  ORF Transcript_98404/g.300929 Transcript_98404/m.300929 type:complete len:82 (+) Transcript_98404:534-779(+)
MCLVRGARTDADPVSFISLSILLLLGVYAGLRIEEYDGDMGFSMGDVESILSSSATAGEYMGLVVACASDTGLCASPSTIS